MWLCDKALPTARFGAVPRRASIDLFMVKCSQVRQAGPCLPESSFLLGGEDAMTSTPIGSVRGMLRFRYPARTVGVCFGVLWLTGGTPKCAFRASDFRMQAVACIAPPCAFVFVAPYLGRPGD